MRTYKKHPGVDLKLIYKNSLSVGMVLSLLIMIFIFYSFRSFESGFTLPDKPVEDWDVITIPQTKQLKQPPPPLRPSIPIESDDENLLDDVTIAETIDFDANDDLLPPPPQSDEVEVYEFTAVTEKPILIHKEVPQYPELAKKAGIQGTVVITVTINEKGNVEKAVVLKSIPMLEIEALNAAKKCRFKPAKQRDKYVKVRMSIPFTFRLN